MQDPADRPCVGRDGTLAGARDETLPREHEPASDRTTLELDELRCSTTRRAVTRHLPQLGRGRQRFIGPGGESNRKPVKINARWPGHVVLLEVKKVGRIPDGG